MAKEKVVKARLFVGRLWAKVTSLFSSDSRFEIQTDNAVAGVRGTAFRLVAIPPEALR
ncbi:MAG: FecR domain-containing protein [Myxococcota bacterium]